MMALSKNEDGWTHSIATRPDFSNKLGIITAEWSALEDHLCLLFRYLLGTDGGRAEAVFFTLTNNRSRREVVASLATSVLPEGNELRNRTNRILRRVKNAAARRNSIVHSILYIGDVGSLGALSFDRKNVKWTSASIEIKDLDQVISQLRILRKDTFELASGVREFLPPLVNVSISGA